MNRNGLKKVQKTVKGQKGTVRRSYWVKANQVSKHGKPTAQQKQPGFIRRNAGKIVGGLALAGAAAYGMHRMSKGGKVWSGSLAHASNKANTWHGSVAHGHELGDGKSHTTARESAINKVRDSWAGARQSFSAAREKGIGGRLTDWRRGEGAKLAHHMAHVGGDAAAEHVGSYAGSRLGGALGTAMGGGVGGAMGSFLGGHAGGLVARGRAAPHIKRGAEWVANRMQR